MGRARQRTAVLCEICPELFLGERLEVGDLTNVDVSTRTTLDRSEQVGRHGTRVLAPGLRVSVICTSLVIPSSDDGIRSESLKWDLGAEKEIWGLRSGPWDGDVFGTNVLTIQLSISDWQSSIHSYSPNCKRIQRHVDRQTSQRRCSYLSNAESAE